jgi:hypothetical protein
LSSRTRNRSLFTAIKQVWIGEAKNAKIRLMESRRVHTKKQVVFYWLYQIRQYPDGYPFSDEHYFDLWKCFKDTTAALPSNLYFDSK